MEELEGILEGIENIDMGEVQKAFMNDPSLRQSAMEMLKNPNLTSELKNYFKGGSKWRNKHRKKRGSGGTQGNLKSEKPTRQVSKEEQERYNWFKNQLIKKEDKKMKPMKYGRPRSGATVDLMEDSHFDLMEDSHFDPLPHREAPEEKIHRLRKEAEAIKKALLEKEKKDIKEGTKVLFGGKWSLKYKRSINCRKPKGFSQKQYCKRKNRKSKKKRKKSRKKRKRKKRKTRRKRR